MNTETWKFVPNDCKPSTRDIEYMAKADEIFQSLIKKGMEIDRARLCADLWYATRSIYPEYDNVFLKPV